MRIVLIKESGELPTTPLEGKFSEQGGTIGRGPECTLVLPDPFRHVSRIQAEVMLSGGQWILTDRGSVNSFARGGLEFGRNKQTVLNDQDILTIGEYELRVELTSVKLPSATTDFNPEPVAASAFWSNIAAPKSAANHPFDDLFPEANIADQPFKPRASPTPNALIPDDFDIFAAPQATPVPEGIFGSSLGVKPELSFGGSSNPLLPESESLDNLFGLNSKTSTSPNLIGQSIDDPLAGFASNSSGIEAFGLEAAKPLAPVEPQQRQDSPEINTSFILPQAVFPARVIASESISKISSHTPQVVPVAPSQPPRTKVLSNDPATADNLRAITNAAADLHQARMIRQDAEPVTETLAGVNRQTAEALRREAAAKAAKVVVEPAEVSDAQFDLLKNLLVGLGLAELPKSQAPGVQAPSVLSPELMLRIGQIIKISTHGLLEMLEARNLLKREMKAEVTMILKGGNNPLKFSPDALGAVAHLLSPHGVRGFMAPTEALQDAFDDLLAHQVGFIAGMRAATGALVQRFDPAHLEQRLEKKSIVETVLPGKRKSKLWERYEELYSEIKTEAEDDFEALFGRAFVDAYEAQVEQIKQQRQERG